MLKAYVVRYKSREKLEVGTVDVDFATCPYDWETRQAAENACSELESLSCIKIEINGRSHVCGGFRVEEWEDGKFAVFCEIA
jgi:hypothetical protein